MAASYSLTSSIYVNISELEPGRSSFGIKNPYNVWESCWMWLSDDILHSRRSFSHNPGLQLIEEEIRNLALIEIEIILRRLVEV
ncbi:hypothetical protein CASFOL_016792 [Castilleja foliolosa]|uniref:Uncharacterized protein n=1 Tax=Castilleja foliolosa TaxID=1961234 RepID=A0ABD3D988_9LAMI